ncbi:MAG: DNA polymerase III subunit delta' [Candidatus Omnitrophota bacterium]
MQGLNQGVAQEAIRNVWEKKRLASSYLFFGPEGTGRAYLARSLAKTVNCDAGSFPPCLDCPSCRKVEHYNHPDVHYVEKQNSDFIKIEQIHQMQREIYLRPYEGKCKAFIIFNAEGLTEESSNCLLKIIEEPPENSLIILIASDLRRIIPTIISRCHKIRFFALGRREAEDILTRNYNLGGELSHYLAFAYEGKLGEALKFKDSGILNEKNEIIRHFIKAPGLMFDKSRASPKSDIPWEYTKLRDKYDSMDREKLNWILKALIGCIRDIYLLKIGINDNELINRDIKDELRRLAKDFSFSDLNIILKRLCDWLGNVRQNINPKLLVDNLRLVCT